MLDFCTEKKQKTKKFPILALDAPKNDFYIVIRTISNNCCWYWKRILSYFKFHYMRNYALHFQAEDFLPVLEIKLWLATSKSPQIVIVMKLIQIFSFAVLLISGVILKQNNCSFLAATEDVLFKIIQPRISTSLEALHMMVIWQLFHNLPTSTCSKQN